MGDAGGVAGLVLAAGASSRMGRFKLTLPFGDEPVVARSARVALEGGLGPVVVVTGVRAEEVERALSGLRDGMGRGGRLLVARNPEPSRGPGSSLATGLEALLAERPGTEAVAVTLGDEPGLDPEAVRAVVAAWREGAKLARVVYRDRPGHPVLFDRVHLEELSAAGPRGGAELLARHASRAREVRRDGAGPVDVDTPADYRAALARAGLPPPEPGPEGP